MDSQAFSCKHLSPLPLSHSPTVSLSLSPSDMRTVSCNFLFLSASRGPINLRHSWRNSPLPPPRALPLVPPVPQTSITPHSAARPVTPQSGRVQLLVGSHCRLSGEKNGQWEQSEVINLSRPGREGDNSICEPSEQTDRIKPFTSTVPSWWFHSGVHLKWASVVKKLPSTIL